MINGKKRLILFLLFVFMIMPVSIAAETVYITNLGQLGFDLTNQDYTSIRTVVLHIDYSQNSTYCRAKNNLSSWSGSNWETCVSEKYWLLSDTSGNKTVNVQINHTNGTVYSYDDWIYYNYTGAGLDTTPPSEVIVIDGDYSNSNDALSISWGDAIDAESDILKIPLLYSYIVLANDVPIINYSVWSENKNFELSAIFSHGDNVTVIVNATNSANLQSSTISDGLLIDLVNPDQASISCNLTAATWHYSKSIFMNWSSQDALSGIDGYSISFSTDNSVFPDNILDGDFNDLANYINDTFAAAKTGKYKLRVKAKDNAGNFGVVGSYNVWIDLDRPTKPQIIRSQKIFNSNSINFSWTASFDEHSGVKNYIFEVYNDSAYNNKIDNFTLSNATYSYLYVPSQNYSTYYARVKAVDFVNLSSQWSNEETRYDWTAPVIALIAPNGTVDANSDIKIILETDETAVCYYENSSNDYVIFMFTNSSYHETLPDGGGGSYNINCTDLSGNSASIATAYSVDNSAVSAVSITSNPVSYVNRITTIQVNITPAKSNVLKNRFNLTINNSAIDFNVDDRGGGQYLVSFISLDTAGSYPLQVFVDSSSDTEILNVSSLNLVASYYDIFSNYTNLNHITYTNQIFYTGLASDSKTVTINTGNNNLSLSAGIDGKTYFFATGKSPNFNKREVLLKNNQFIEQNKASFGYMAVESNLIYATLSFDNIYVSANETLDSGTYNLLIKKLRKTGAKKNILITSKISNYNGEGIIQYG